MMKLRLVRLFGPVLLLAVMGSCRFDCTAEVEIGVTGPLMIPPARGTLPDSDEIVTQTQVFHIAWTHPAMANGDTFGIRIIAKSVPGRQQNNVVLAEEVPIHAASDWGTLPIVSPSGWLPGQYEMEFLLNNFVFGTISFDVTGPLPTEVPFAGAGPLLEQPEFGELPEPDAVVQETPAFFVSWTHPAAGGESVEIQLIAVDVEGLDANHVIMSGSAPVGLGTNAGYFQLDRPSGGWSPGHYAIQLLHNEAVFSVQVFDVEATETP